VRCPFLREEQVKSCRAAPFRKPLARSVLKGADERCTSPAHVSCPVAPHSRQAHPAPARCPFLQESLVQFCAAAPLPTYVPWSESQDLRCSHDGHRFCEAYLGASGPRGRGPARRGADPAEAAIHEVGDLPMPGWLAYAPNHLWLDLGDDGLLHIGADAFLARLVGRVEGLAFLAVRGRARPTVVLRAGDVDLTLSFPHPLQLVAANTRLRADLARLTADPYGLGWLFEARSPQEPAALETGLRRGEAARAWMARELRRTAELVLESAGPRAGLGPLLADGGGLAGDLLRHLRREEVLRLFAELFAPFDHRRPS
jgi:glycine cleavage system H lipoate-binding protein